MLRYYPSFRIKKNQVSQGGQFTLNGQPYLGKYYETFDGDCYTGSDPITGKSELLTKVLDYQASKLLNDSNLTQKVKRQLAKQSNISTQLATEPIPFYPMPSDADYKKGFINRYFTKKINSKGYIIEINEEQYNSIVNGTALFDVSFYQVVSLIWKITGTLNTVRVSQYDTRIGIIDSNKRLVEVNEPNFLGLTEYIGGQYAKYAKPTT